MIRENVVWFNWKYDTIVTDNTSFYVNYLVDIDGNILMFTTIRNWENNHSKLINTRCTK